jgi:hypothetical protein
MFINLNLGEIMWKERLWQVFLVVILGLTLTMCSRTGSNNNSSSSSNANAEETSTVSVSSMPSLKVESLPTITLDSSSTVSVSSLPTITLTNAGLTAISQTMFCTELDYSSGVVTYSKCDASDDTVLSNGEITHDEAFAAGWKHVGSGCGGGHTSVICTLFHK